MNHLGSKAPNGRRSRLRHLGLLAAIASAGAAAAAAGGCGGGDTTTSTTSTSSTTTTSTTSTTTTGTGGGGGTGGTATTTTSTTSTTSTTAGSGGGTGGSGGSGGSAPVCPTLGGPTKGSAIAISPNDKRIVTVNRDVGSVTVMSVDYADMQPKMTVVAEIPVGGEPWQVAIDGCGTTAYVVLRKDQKVVKIENIDGGSPTKGATVDVGSEPTGIAITPNSKKLYVSNWVEGTLSVIDPFTLKVTGTVDLNKVLVDTGVLGMGLTPRVAMAHPRGLAITNNGDANDDDETVYATEWFAARTGPEDASGTKSDTNWKGLLYSVKVNDNGSATSIDLPSVADTGFKDSKAQATGCFPNQVSSVTIEGSFAYVTSTCASPVGPIGAFQKGTCTVTANCASFGAASTCLNGLCTLTCATDADCGFGAQAGACSQPAGQCAIIPTNFKTTTHPAVSIVDLAMAKATTTVLDAKFDAKGAGRMPLLPTDVEFVPGGFGYVTGMGSDAVFRLVTSAGSITDVGSAANLFINLRKDAADTLIRLPIGIVRTQTAANAGFAFVNNDGAREVAALNLGAQALAGTGAADVRITSSSPLPAAGSAADTVLRGKRFFTTGLGRWSLKGQGWGSCAACHIDGLTDNVTWYFARGPRQTVSLDGSFSSADPNDQRIFNWTGIFDEVADFEGNVRGISGGVGAIVKAPKACAAAADCLPGSGVCNPNGFCALGVQDRINTATEVPPQQGLQGSSADTANPMGSGAHPHSVLNDWKEVTDWVKTVRSPRKPKGLVAADVAAGKTLFTSVAQGNCVGCHSGPKWTISTLFYTPGDVPNAATADMAATSLSKVTWNTMLNMFPAALMPAADPVTNGFMRFGAPPGAEQLQCILRPVGTILPPVAPSTVPGGVSDPEVGVLELRQDMVTGGQGAADTGRGFNPPSLLGMQVGAPFYHAGNARTLEEVFSDLFLKHHQSAVASVFSPTPAQVKQMVAYVLSLDEDEAPIAIPAKGKTGGDLCFYP